MPIRCSVGYHELIVVECNVTMQVCHVNLFLEMEFKHYLKSVKASKLAIHSYVYEVLCCLAAIGIS
jgi:hypothetical protein